MSTNVSTKPRMNIHTLAKISILAALACIVMLLEFPLPIAPPFYQLDFSEVIVLIGGFSLGPWAAICIEALKIVLNLLFNASITMGVGELGNFLIGCAFVLPPVILYQKGKTKRHALLGLCIGVVMMCVVGGLINYFILIPAYINLAGLSMDSILHMGKAIYSGIDGLFSLIIVCVVPFNLIKGSLISIIVFLCYKKVSPLLKK